MRSLLKAKIPLGFATFVSAVICTFIALQHPATGGPAIKITPSSSVGARLAAIDNASENEVPSYEAKVELVSSAFKVDQGQVFTDIQESSKALKKAGESATMMEYLNGLSLAPTYESWIRLPAYCRFYVEARQQRLSNDKAWESASVESSATKNQ